MARTAVTKNTFTGHTAAGLTDPTPTTLDATNHHVIAAPSESELLVLKFKNTTATSKGITLKAGAGYPLVGQGDLALTAIAQNAIRWYGPFTSARFMQADGTINIDVDSGATGEITAYVIPRNV